MAEAYNTDWTGVPRTDDAAQPVAFRQVERSPAIHVHRASIRNAVIENVHFELVEYGAAREVEGGKHRVEVKCLWYGRKPETTWMHLTIDGPYTELREFTGDVVDNIAKEENR